MERASSKCVHSAAFPWKSVVHNYQLLYNVCICHCAHKKQLEFGICSNGYLVCAMIALLNSLSALPH